MPTTDPNDLYLQNLLQGATFFSTSLLAMKKKWFKWNDFFLKKKRLLGQ